MKKALLLHVLAGAALLGGPAWAYYPPEHVDAQYTEQERVAGTLIHGADCAYYSGAVDYRTSRMVLRNTIRDQGLPVGMATDVNAENYARAIWRAQGGCR